MANSHSIKLIIIGLVVLSISAPAIAGPIFDSAQLAVAQQAPVVKTERRSPELYWSGVAVAGVGGYLLGWGLGSKHQVTCAAFFSVVSCQETGGNRGAFMGIGAAVMGTGIAMSVIGGKRVAIAPSLHGVTGIVRF